MLSVDAEENDYRFAGRMFPIRENIKSVLFVRSDSSIQTIKDLNNKTIALGTFDSVPSYYLPLYYLYGSTLKVDDGNSQGEILEKVLSGQADVGAAVDAFLEGRQRRDPQLKQKIRSLLMNSVISAVVLSQWLRFICRQNSLKMNKTSSKTFC